jgi:hypothetical protein
MTTATARRASARAKTTTHALPNAPQPPKPLSRDEINEYLAYACSALIERRDELVAALREMAATYETIDDDDTLGVVAENMRMANTLRRSADDTRKQQKDPFLSGGRTVDLWFSTFGQPLSDVCEPIQRAMDAYGKRKLAAQRAAAEAERARAQAEADRQAERAAQRMTSEALNAAALAAQEADRAEIKANARPAELTRTRGDYGAVASVRSTWSWEITDIAAVPRQYMIVSPDSIKEAAKQRDPSGKPVAEIPGIRWVEQTRMGVR